MHAAMINLEKLFAYKELKTISPAIHGYETRNKIVTFIPLGYVDKLTFDMANAGAGKIGNYTVCSFRMKGLGTFIPGKTSNPFSGKKGKMSFEEEVRLEMECPPELTENVIDALLNGHPYDEPVYEIYKFRRRAKVPAGYFVETRKKYTLKDLLLRLNRNVDVFSGFTSKKLSRFLVVFSDIGERHEAKAKEKKLQAIISIDKSKYKIKLL